jgi:hypothetical protein
MIITGNTLAIIFIIGVAISIVQLYFIVYLGLLFASWMIGSPTPYFIPRRRKWFGKTPKGQFIIALHDLLNTGIDKKELSEIIKRELESRK